MKKKNIFDVLFYLIVTTFSAFCIIPMILVFMISITDESAIKVNGYSFFPELFSLDSYRMIFIEGTTLARSYGVTIFVTVVGTFLAVIITGLAAYSLANKHVKYRDSIALAIFVTMIFNTGIVPWYMVCHKLGLYNNIWALIIPSLIFNPFNLFLVRNFMKGIPDSIMESATIDGADDILIAFKIYFPLSIPALAAVTLFYGLAYWNNWWNAIMLVDNSKLYPLQYLLFKLQSEIKMLQDIDPFNTMIRELPTESLKMATTIVTIGPIIFLYPFLQKYFIKGLIIGSVKG